MKFNSIHGLFLGIFVCANAIHINVYLGWSPNYMVCVTQYMFVGTFGYFLYTYVPELYNYLKGLK